jgi:hypothetical protein
VLSPVPGFVPKSKRGFSANRPFVIKALPVSPGDGDDSGLCPVRALKEFLPWSERLFGSSQCLFPSFSDPSSPLSAHGLKSFF